MKYTCGFVLIALAVSACAFPSGPAETVTETPSLADLINQAQAGITNLGKEIQEKLNLPDQESVINTIKSQSSSLAATVQNYINTVSEDVKAKSPELEKAWTEVKTRLNQVVEDINAQIPNAKEQASQLQEKVTNGLQILVEESSKAAKAISSNSEKVQEDVAKFTKQAVEIAVQTTKNFDTQLRQLAVTEAPK